MDYSSSFLECHKQLNSVHFLAHAHMHSFSSCYIEVLNQVHIYFQYCQNCSNGNIHATTCELAGDHFHLVKRKGQYLIIQNGGYPINLSARGTMLVLLSCVKLQLNRIYCMHITTKNCSGSSPIPTVLIPKRLVCSKWDINLNENVT